MKDLPRVPDQFIDIGLTLIKNTQDISASQNQNPTQCNRIVVKNGQEYSTRINPRFGLEEYMSDWVNSNISSEWSHISIADSRPGPRGIGDGSVHGPHSDLTRSYLLLYLLEVGSDNQQTVFFQEPGKNIRRKRNTTVQNVDQLIKIDSIQIPLQTWVYMDTTILHGIENVYGSRIAIHIGFDCDPLGVFVVN